MVASGELPAAIGVEVDHPDVKSLIPAPREAAFAALRDHGHYPINHLMVVKDDVLFSRGWSWPTEKDALAVLESSRYMADNKQIEKALTWDKVRTQFQRTAPLVKQAYDRLGGKPAAPEFLRTDVSDLRGRPVWEMDKWGNPS